MNRYTIALALTLLTAPAMAQTPSVQQVQAQARNLSDQLDVARADRGELLTKLDQQRALFKEVWSEYQAGITQLNNLKRDNDDLKKQLAIAKKQAIKPAPVAPNVKAPAAIAAPKSK